MNSDDQHCVREARSRAVAATQDVTGLDYAELGKDDRTLVVYFMGKAPLQFEQHLDRVASRVLGGQRIKDIQVERIELVRATQRDEDDRLVVELDRSGDFSSYTLELVARDEAGKPTDNPPPGLDQRYNRVTFNFAVETTVDIDCRDEAICPPEQYDQPVINYLAKDYASFRTLILDRLALVMPEWRERHVPDFGIAMVEVLAYVGDYLSYYQDAVATEAYLHTARQRISVRRHARLVDYHLHEGCNARAWLHINTNVDWALQPPYPFFVAGQLVDVRPDQLMLTPDDLRNTPSEQYRVFEPVEAYAGADIPLYTAHNEIHFYTWGDVECCLPEGATTATLRDEWVPVQEDEGDTAGENDVRQTSAKKPDRDRPPRRQRKLRLQAGDVLLFEEVINPGTGSQADVDMARRHVVRLTRVTPRIDALYDQPVLEIEWHTLDALPFPLCISAIGPAPACELLENVSVARGNLLLVDHGFSVEEDAGTVGIAAQEPVCAFPPCETGAPQVDEHGEPIVEVIAEPAKFRPVLGHAPLTFREMARLTDGPASRLLEQDPRAALPAAVALSIPPLAGFALPLFTPDDLRNPKQLAIALLDAERSYKVSALYRQLSHQTRRLLGHYDPEADDQKVADRLPPPLDRALTGDLEALLGRWEPRRDLIASGPQDRHFVSEIDNERVAHLRFGDGSLGAMPDAGMTFVVTYRIGNGPAGNVGAETIRRIVFRDNVPGGLVLVPKNPLPARGGTAPEPLADAKLYAPHAFRSDIKRAITAEDYARVAEQHPDVQRAAASLCWMGSWYEVKVAIDPYGADEASAALLSAVTAHLRPYRRIGHAVKVRPAVYVPLDIELRVQVLPHHLRGHVKAALRRVFSNRVLPDGTLGFFHPDNLTFGKSIHLSALVAAAQAVEGVEYVAVTRLKRYFELPNQERELGRLLIGPFEIPRCDNDRNFPENGSISFIMEGGR